MIIWDIITLIIGSFLLPFVPLILSLLSAPARIILFVITFATNQRLAPSTYNLLLIGLSMSFWFTVVALYLFQTIK